MTKNSKRFSSFNNLSVRRGLLLVGLFRWQMKIQKKFHSANDTTKQCELPGTCAGIHEVSRESSAARISSNEFRSFICLKNIYRQDLWDFEGANESSLPEI